MTTPTMIRKYFTGEQVATVISVSTPHGFTAHFQVYTAGVQGTYEYGMPWKDERPAVAQFERFLDAWRYLNTPAEKKHNHHAQNAVKAALVTNYIKERKAEGYDHECAKREAHFFYRIGS